MWQDGARDGHTGAVAAAARRLAREHRDMLTLPGDIPLVRAGRHARAPGSRTAPFAITPARDDLGSNAVLCAPPEVVPLRFGDNSFFPHLAAAQARGIAPKVLRLPRIALDIDTPEDLALFLATPSRTRARALLDTWRIGAALDVGRMDRAHRHERGSARSHRRRTSHCPMNRRCSSRTATTSLR